MAMGAKPGILQLHDSYETVIEFANSAHTLPEVARALKLEGNFSTKMKSDDIGPSIMLRASLGLMGDTLGTKRAWGTDKASLAVQWDRAARAAIPAMDDKCCAIEASDLGKHFPDSIGFAHHDVWQDALQSVLDDTDLDPTDAELARVRKLCVDVDALQVRYIKWCSAAANNALGAVISTALQDYVEEHDGAFEADDHHWTACKTAILLANAFKTAHDVHAYDIITTVMRDAGRATNSTHLDSINKRLRNHHLAFTSENRALAVHIAVKNVNAYYENKDNAIGKWARKSEAGEDILFSDFIAEVRKRENALKKRIAPATPPFDLRDTMKPKRNTPAQGRRTEPPAKINNKSSDTKAPLRPESGWSYVDGVAVCDWCHIPSFFNKKTSTWHTADTCRKRLKGEDQIAIRGAAARPPRVVAAAHRAAAGNDFLEIEEVAGVFSNAEYTTSAVWLKPPQCLPQK